MGVLDDIHNFCQNLSKNRRISGELNNVTLAELPSNIIRQTLVLTCSLRVESLHTLFAVCGSTQSQLALVTTKFYPYTVGRGGVQI